MNIYAGNLPHTVSEERLRELFEGFGHVASVTMIKDKFTGALRGFAFVEMPSAHEAQQAISSLNGKEIDGQRIKVNEARPKEEGGRPARPRMSSDRPPRRDNNHMGGWRNNR